MEEKLKKKRRRNVALIIIGIVIVVMAVISFRFEYADYSKVLAKEIVEASELLEKADTGNGEGQYAKFTLLDFQKKIDAAQKVADDENAEYYDEKDAYETLKEDESEFKKSTNSDVLSKNSAENLAKSGESKEVTIDIGNDKTATWKVSGDKIEKPTTINFMAKSEGPNNATLMEYVESLKLQGATISLYHEGDMGGRVSLSIPIYSEKDGEAYVYSFDSEKGSLTYEEKATIKITKDREEGSGDATATFDVTCGGDYIVLTERIKDKDGKELEEVKKEDVEEQSKEASSNEDKDSSKNSSSSNSSKNDSNKASNSTKEDDGKIAVTIEIRNDTWSKHRSDILPKMTYRCEPGSTVFDVLNEVCRNKGIQIESSYTEAYGSYYVEGIDGLYEFDGGSESGWKYMVNGVYPNYGCSSYTLEGGETIVWTYTVSL